MELKFLVCSKNKSCKLIWEFLKALKMATRLLTAQRVRNLTKLTQAHGQSLKACKNS